MKIFIDLKCNLTSGPLTNALLTMVPPGIANPDIKSKLPLQTFQRVFHLDSQEENSKVDLNVLLRGANDEPEVCSMTGSPEILPFQ